MDNVVDTIEVVLCDVFGTVVDWRGSLTRQIEALCDNRGWEFDAAEFTDQWRSQYGPSMNKVLSGELPWTNLDGLHRQSLQALLDENAIVASQEDIDSMVNFWHRLDAWPDAAEGIRRLKRRFIVGTMSNGNVALLTDVAKYADLDWDVILSAELARLYKKDLDCYRHNVVLLGRPLSAVLMVAAHPGELEAVSGIGMRTAFVNRPNEFGSHGQALPPGQQVDFSCNGLDELAGALGV
jgi:2-haloacid dehalogenase